MFVVIIIILVFEEIIKKIYNFSKNSNKLNNLFIRHVYRSEIIFLKI